MQQETIALQSLCCCLFHFTLFLFMFFHDRRVERVPDNGGDGDYLAMITQYIPGGSLHELLEHQG